ncbi:SDR family oxidoreductase [Ethanoligenens harbinense]|uniref:Short-chain dehydrogenase/reductase SDR n=1 Tax=Ethanoligenens harbinense (strain DSM 18485 / JCM 12961 / CGMCC 1.5033 / YUAN-3) TaxID=663278 RepID=E6U9A2_ETHHY|nr:SDR family oxidoreductase [Ethanoligenens harbinense]ADU27261.1 short-chain dehydrogenase/reductase SDR [Ethanoligenens harbinense YUAN-3]AVQ96326.1 3-ketoacyl-ACP reductase [Ethanoligenens harbinense YUAN-3]AYF38984.1 3-ketoacyl-ACP reductase [Ethanoligenens harbinense]AYF41737.1 3-ketoacyl-ACP reductase [Ethanoligenens harbinense]QCN92567.1 SDR family NAD(P)-dependent oxidoreductase [Ethanoligenens harbinense]
MKLDSKVAVITGASSGMGRAMALLFAKEGAHVIAMDRNMGGLKTLARDADGMVGSVGTYEGDVTDRKGMEVLLDQVVQNHGKLDILVNNAGIMDEMMPAGEVSDELWERVLHVNLNGPLYLCRKAIGQMLKQGQGNIINIASIGGLQGARAGAAYTASKFALVGLSKNIGFMYANKGIRCNAICPGSVQTNIGVGIANPSALGMERAMSGIAGNPRMGAPEEIARVALFLASDDASFINGAVIVADGGWTAY